MNFISLIPLSDTFVYCFYLHSFASSRVIANLDIAYIFRLQNKDMAINLGQNGMEVEDEVSKCREQVFFLIYKRTH